ncbi:MAG: GNAT family N-acetyltransferase [Phycisphaerales bacterium JB059]
MGIEVVRLGGADAGAYQAIRREMLEDAPWAFLASRGDDSAEDTAQLQRRLRDPENVILAVRSPEGVAAVAGVRRIERMKMRHWASVWGVYTSPSYRRRGYSRALLEGAIELVRTWGGVEMLGIAVSANAPEALRLYESVGFVAWGREPRVTRVGQNTYDEIHLAMSL